MNRSRLIILTITAAIACLVLSACGGSSAAEPTPKVISPLDLPGLVLPVQQVVVDGTALQYDANDSGPQTRADIIGDNFDSDWQRQTITQFKWQAEYYQDFGTGGGSSPVFDGSVGIALYDTEENAGGALADRYDHILTWQGQTYKGLIVSSVTRFDVEDLNARGFRLQYTSDTGAVYYLTNIDFVRGPVVVDVGTASTDDRDLLSTTKDLVRQVDAHLAEAGLRPAP